VTDVNINIEAMRAMLNGLHKARDNVTNLRSDLDALLNKVAGWPRVHADRPVEASTGRLNDVLYWIDDSIPDINRRLALAEDVASATPTFRPGDTVWIDDDRITGLSTWQAGARGREIAQLLADGGMTDQDWDDLATLSTDPYFAVALANRCPPQTLAQTALNLSGQYQTRLRYQGDEYAAYQARGGDQTLSDWAAAQSDAYQQRLESLGIVLGAATRTGQLNQGYADQVVAVFQQQGPLPAAMGAVLGYGAYSTGFAHTVAAGVYDYERGDDFPGSWSQGVAAGTGFTLPDGSQLTDPMPGVMTMLSTSPDAAQQFFTQGGTTTVTLDGQQFQVNSRLQYLIAERTWSTGRGSDEGDGLGRALDAATGNPSSKVSDQVFAIVDAKTMGENGWKPYTDMRDGLASIMQRGDYRHLDDWARAMGLSNYAARLTIDSWKTDKDTPATHDPGSLPTADDLAPYHMDDDPGGVQGYAPYGAGSYAQSVTEQERGMLQGLSAFALLAARDISQNALTEAASLYPGTVHNGTGDAFRHAYWNAMLSARFGQSWTKCFTTAHEGGVDGDELLRLEETMDLYNNQVGRQIAFAHPNATEAELQAYIQDAISRGSLLVVDLSDPNGPILRWSS
jgi:hypothetical protein